MVSLYSLCVFSRRKGLSLLANGTTNSWNPLHFGGDAQAELGKETGGAVEVFQAHDFHGAVHVAIGDADQAGCDAIARKLDGVGVGARRLGHATRLNGYLLG